MSERPEWFENWFDSPYYHQLYFQQNEAEAAAFIERLLLILQPPAGAFMLDVASGMGRHSRQLARHGFQVTGIDLSGFSVAAAKGKSGNAENPAFYVHDMRQPFWINYFHYAFNFFTSFGYFRTLREHQASIRTISSSLKPGGEFVIDYLNTHYVEEHLKPVNDVEIDGTNFHLTRWMDENHFYKKIEVERDDFTEPLVYTEKVAKFSPGDFTDMLSYQGLQVKEIFGDYELNNYHIRQSPRMIIIAKKVR